jgi:hypothetical protein
MITAEDQIHEICKKAEVTFRDLHQLFMQYYRDSGKPPKDLAEKLQAEVQANNFMLQQEKQGVDGLQYAINKIKLSRELAELQNPKPPKRSFWTKLF